ncbi:hypothetical protein ACFFNY_34495 [Paenibacillus hodogayensis]|uniref:Uncharacterized protein n=1 Tax=Paenibacillus hodogayensis TaxID=279208 RepID=A0ABV5W7Z5_9BACL
MDRTPMQTDLGHGAESETTKGTLFIYDSFELTEEGEASADGGLDVAALQMLTKWAEQRWMTRAVLYVPHEETLKRMGVHYPSPLYKREKHLKETVERLDAAVPFSIDGWEHKRKKYTPIDVALRYMHERYASPYFIGMSAAYANRFASYQGFEDWIRRLRLVVVEEARPFDAHPLLRKHENRWHLLRRSER